MRCSCISGQTWLFDNTSQNVSRLWVSPSLVFPNHLTILYQNVFRLWVCSSKLDWLAVPKHICLVCECVLISNLTTDNYPSKCVQAVSVSWHFLPNLTGAQNIFRVWVCFYIFYWTWLTLAFKMCSGCECPLAFSLRLNWLTMLLQNVFRVWVF